MNLTGIIVLHSGVVKMKQFSRSKGEKREKYRKKIENWKKSYPQYVEFVLSALEAVE